MWPSAALLTPVSAHNPASLTVPSHILPHHITHRHVLRFPKLIHQTVRNKSRLSCEEKRVIQSWKTLNPGYTHQLWDDADMREFMVKVGVSARLGLLLCLAQAPVIEPISF